MKETQLKYIVEKPEICQLIIRIEKPFLPWWFVDVIRHLAINHLKEKIQIVYSDPKEIQTQKEYPFIYIPFIWLEKLVFRQKLKAFKRISVVEAFKGINSVECIKNTPELTQGFASDYSAVVLNFSKQQTGHINARVFQYPAGVLQSGKRGIIYFIRRYLFLSEALTVYSEDTIVWQHVFQTLAYSIDKNSNFFKAAIKQSIESLWRTDRKVDYEQSNTLEGTTRVNTLMAYWIKWSVKRVYQRLKKIFYHKRWVVIVHNKEKEQQMLYPNGNDGWADPFIIYDKYLFVEQIDAKSGKGHIQVVSLNETGQSLNQTKIIEEPFHLSYPNVIKLDNKWIMIPESAASKGLRLYTSESFPHHWNFVRELQSNVQLLDFTPFYHNELWWMFSIIKTMKDGGSYDQLFLFYTNDMLNSQWLPHKQNPIVTDSSKARPAGNLYIEDGILYRPSQDCFTNYGSRIRLNKVLIMNEKEYEEELYKYIDAASLKTKALGVHTCNKSKNFTVYDAQIWDLK